jgi:putative membrane protein
MKNWRAVIIIVISLLVLIVVLQNTQSVETKFLFITVSMPRALLLFLTFLFGFIVGAVSILGFAKKNKKIPNE